MLLCLSQGCLRDNTHVNITSMADGYALKDDGLLMFSEDSSIESCEYQLYTNIGGITIS